MMIQRRFFMVLAIFSATTLPALIGAPSAIADHSGASKGAYFTSDNGRDLRKLSSANVRPLLNRVKGKGKAFGKAQRVHYCKIRKNSYEIQWVLNNLETNETLARSSNADQLYFGASSSKLFVAAALLDKQNGKFSKKQLSQLIKMIVVSDNPSWLSLQKQVGRDGSSNSGRQAVDAFVKRMGYRTTKGFQGWMVDKNGIRVHGNELNAQELSQFLFDTYKRKYAGADIVWKIIQATRTGKSKAVKYTPKEFFIGGKTGTYSGPNESPNTVKLKSIKSRNHVVAILTPRGHYGISILSNTGNNEDVAVTAGGLMREYLGVGKPLKCK